MAYKTPNIDLWKRRALHIVSVLLVYEPSILLYLNGIGSFGFPKVYSAMYPVVTCALLIIITFDFVRERMQKRVAPSIADEPSKEHSQN
jgi:ABC-type microcin C transport system permease subunit YejB